MSVAEAINSARKIELWKVCQNIFHPRVGILKVPWEGTAKAVGITFRSRAMSIWEVYYQRKSKRKRELVQLYHLPSDRSRPPWMNVQVIQPPFCRSRRSSRKIKSCSHNMHISIALSNLQTKIATFYPGRDISLQATSVSPRILNA